MTIQVSVDGQQVELVDDGGTLLGALRDQLGVRSVKDGCSPQGQCGCCTVLVDGAPRVSCVTPLRRVRGREVTTPAGLTADERERWAAAFLTAGASQCGFCTPGIVCRLVGHERRGGALDDRGAIDTALAAHLCRCTGWQTIVEASVLAAGGGTPWAGPPRDLALASERASLETGGPQVISAAAVLGAQPFTDDSAPAEALVAVRGTDGWVVGDTLHEARQVAAKVQGRRTTLDPVPPIELPAGEWAVTLATSWAEPAYLETDASWCVPGGDPVSPLLNGGAFGGKLDSDAGDVARRLADEHGRPVRVLWSREDTVQRGPKRPPLAAGLRSDGTGIVRVAATTGVSELLRSRLPGCQVEEIHLAGPPTSLDLRAAGWAEAELLLAALRGSADWVQAPGGGRARAQVDADGIHVEVDGGDPLDTIMLRSYAIGAAHMAWSWITSEHLVVDPDGVVHDLTVRSFGVLKSANTPHIAVDLGGPGTTATGAAVPAGDAVFAAVAAAAWLYLGAPGQLPAG